MKKKEKLSEESGERRRGGDDADGTLLMVERMDGELTGDNGETTKKVRMERR